MIRPENKELNESQKQRVIEKVRERGFACRSCHSEDFEVGEALYLGFLFLDEPLDNYMVALTCKESDCDSPRTGIKLPGSAFLGEQ